MEETLAGCTVVDLLARAPDEVCCWPRRRGDRDAGTGAVVESYREDVAGRDAVVAKLLLVWGRH